MSGALNELSDHRARILLEFLVTAYLKEHGQVPVKIEIEKVGDGKGGIELVTTA